MTGPVESILGIDPAHVAGIDSGPVGTGLRRR